MLLQMGRVWRASVKAAIVAAVIGFGQAARAGEQDFPPGSFSDGNKYSLNDFEGKVVVLFFYEKDCPSCRGTIPERNKIVDQFAGKPVKFFAVAPGDTLVDARSYVSSTRLKMTTFSDLFGVMQGRFNTGEISLRNIYQFRVIGTDGQIVARSMKAEDIEAAVADAKWKYKDGGYDARLNPILEGLEWGQYEQAVRALRPFTKSGNKVTMESAKKLWDVLLTEAKASVEEAAKLSESDPVKAFDKYTKVANAFSTEDIGKQAAEAIKTLKTNKTIADELAARKLWAAMATATAKAQMNQKPAFVAQAQAIAKKYPETPTGKLAGELAGELEVATAK